MNCPDPQTISAFTDGELEAAQVAEVEQHVAACASCRQLVEEMQWLEGCGRAALRAIHVGDASAPNVVPLRPRRRQWARPISWSAAAAALIAVSSWTWFALSHFTSHQAALAPRQIVEVMPTADEASGLESPDAAFEHWAEPYRKLQIPLVPMDIAASYNPEPIQPIQLYNN